jgi:hypothetical protein
VFAIWTLEPRFPGDSMDLKRDVALFDLTQEIFGSRTFTNHAILQTSRGSRTANHSRLLPIGLHAVVSLIKYPREMTAVFYSPCFHLRRFRQVQRYAGSPGRT